MAPATSSVAPSSEPATADQFNFKTATFEQILDDLSSRFILNMPTDQLESVERVSFSVEQAHWFYEDFVREEQSSLRSLSLREFSAILFRACPLLQAWVDRHEKAFNSFMAYKTRVPVCGAVLINETWDKCVLVKGWKASAGWGFPKGKINQEEDTAHCAIREVLEETGYDISPLLRQDDHITLTIKEQRVTLYIIHPVPEDTVFETRTRKEISMIKWFKFADLPTWNKSREPVGKFYLISAFIPHLKNFIKARKRQLHTISTVDDHLNEARVTNGRGNESYASMPPSSPGSSQNSSTSHSAPANSILDQMFGKLRAESVQQITSDTPDNAGEHAQNPDPHFMQLLDKLSLSADAALKDRPKATNGSRKSSGGYRPPSVAPSTVEPTSPSAKSDASIWPPVVTPHVHNTRPVPLNLSETDRLGSTRAASTPHFSLSPTEPAASGAADARKLQHLALLESVAGESLRTAPFIPIPSPSLHGSSMHPGISPVLPHITATNERPIVPVLYPVPTQLSIPLAHPNPSPLPVHHLYQHNPSYRSNSVPVTYAPLTSTLTPSPLPVHFSNRTQTYPPPNEPASSRRQPVSPPRGSASAVPYPPIGPIQPNSPSRTNPKPNPNNNALLSILNARAGALGSQSHAADFLSIGGNNGRRTPLAANK